jgi:hypothetical protein
LIAYTRTGDANLDGLVNDDDVTVLGAAYAPGASNGIWALGDFEYNGFIDDDDVTLLGAFYNPAAGPLAAPAFENARNHEAESALGPEDRNAIAPAVRPGTTFALVLSRSGGPAHNRFHGPDPSDLLDLPLRVYPGLYGPASSLTALPAYELDDAANGDAALIDLLANATATSGQHLSRARLPASSRILAAEAIWADNLWNDR